MIFSFCRNVTAKIVVPRPNTVNVFCGKRQKFTRALPTDHTPRQTRAAGSGELFDHLVGAVCKRWLVPAVWSSERHLEQEKYCYDYNDSQYHRQWLVKDRHIKRPL